MTKRDPDSREEVSLSSKEIGDLGERLAKSWLVREGYRILWKNYRTRTGGEVDIICRDSDTLLFVEVKARTSEDYGRPVEAVNEAKQRLIIRGAMDWLRKLGMPEILFRFDVIEVILRDGEIPEITRIENAFQLPEDSYY